MECFGGGEKNPNTNKKPTKTQNPSSTKIKQNTHWQPDQHPRLKALKVHVI